MDFLRMIVAAFFAFLIAKAVGAAIDPDARHSGATPTRRDASRLIVPCATCGVYVLRERALQPSGRAHFCSTACAIVTAG